MVELAVPFRHAGWEVGQYLFLFDRFDGGSAEGTAAVGIEEGTKTESIQYFLQLCFRFQVLHQIARYHGLAFQ